MLLAVLPRAGIIHSREIIFHRDTLEIQISRALAVHFALPRCRSPVDQTIAQKIAPEYENTNERRKNGVGGDVTSFLREQKGERERERERPVTRLQRGTTLVIGHRFPFGFQERRGLDLIQFNPAGGCPNFAAFMQIQTRARARGFPCVS